jgi:hypothetical protein
MLLAHKIELQLIETQREYLNKACGTVRHGYNCVFLQMLNDIFKPLFL